MAHRLANGAIVVVADVETVEGKAHLAVREVLRGTGIGRRLTIAFRALNFGRSSGEAKFTVETGERAVFVLDVPRDSSGDPEAVDYLSPAGGAAGKIPVTGEGGEAILQASRSIVAAQDADDQAAAEAALPVWLDGANPWLVDAALEICARLGAPTRAAAEAVARRVGDADPRRRARAAKALGAALASGRLAPTEAGDQAVSEAREALVRLARTDEDAAVRRAAVRYLARAGVPRAAELLAAAAREDPSQDVRYEAAAALAELSPPPR